MEHTQADQFYDVIFIGGGAASFFSAINLAEARPDLKLLILERGQEVLSKVKISGGGRCNVTHGVFDPKELSTHYPRGQKELLGPFHRFMTGDTVAWFEDRGVPLKIEEDGRMFPESNSSQSIIDCFLSRVEALGIQVLFGQNVQALNQQEQDWSITTKSSVFYAGAAVCATGSSPKMWKLLAAMGLTVVAPVPSLFTFNVQDDFLADLQGISTQGTVTILDADNKAYLTQDGPILITHWGLSGPAILKLSAWGAISLNSRAYQFSIVVNWIGGISANQALEDLKLARAKTGLQKINSRPQFGLTKRLWQRFIKASQIHATTNWADLSNAQLEQLTTRLTATVFAVHGKSTFKEEFVTAGGVDLKQINFKNFKSKVFENLYFAGEVLNIDAVTGGFNFQNAWTGGFLIAQDLATNLPFK